MPAAFRLAATTCASASVLATCATTVLSSCGGPARSSIRAIVAALTLRQRPGLRITCPTMRRLPLAASLLATVVVGQGPPANGPRPVDPGFHALVGGDVVVKPGQKLTGATVVLRDGRIVSVGTAPPPAGARVFDMKGLTLYPGLVEAHLPVDVPAPDATAPGTHWSSMVLAQR